MVYKWNPDKKCCCNCKYHFAHTTAGICLLDNKLIDVEISRITKCNAFEKWKLL